MLPEIHASTPEAGPPEREPRSDLSRRSVLRTAAGAGVAGLAASAMIGAAGPVFAATAHRRSGSDHPTAAASGQHAPGDLVVHVRDAGSGEMDVFTGTSHIRLRDKDLAARLIRAIG